MNNKSITITHRPTGVVLAHGPLGWSVTPFEGNYYISRRHLKDGIFKSNFIPGLCPYKFLYVWMDLLLPDGSTEKNLGWMYWLPNPLLPFIWFRVALPGNHPSLCVEHSTGDSQSSQARDRASLQYRSWLRFRDSYRWQWSI